MIHPPNAIAKYAPDTGRFSVQYAFRLFAFDAIFVQN